MLSDNKNAPIIEDIEYICRAAFSMLKIPVYFVLNNTKILFEFSNKDLNNPLHGLNNPLYSLNNPLTNNNEEQLFEFLKSINKNNSSNTIFTISTKYLENFVFLKVIKNNMFFGTIIIGPSLSLEINRNDIDLLIKNLDIPIKYKDLLSSYYKKMTVINHESLMSTMFIINYSLTNQKIGIENVTEKNDTADISKDIKPNKLESLESYQSSRLQYSTFHHSQKSHIELLRCISEGDIEGLNEFLKKPLGGTPGVHSKNPLRNEKNLFISTVSIICSAAVEGGLDWELALNLSDYYIRYVEELTELKAIAQLHVTMYHDYANRVRMNNLQTSSKVISKCKGFIKRHLYEKIYLEDLSKNMNLNPTYLSHIFKKETGLSISEYILREKVNESKKLMVSPEYSLTDVYEMLSFQDQSYFTKVFKRFTGTTPKKYKILNKEL